MRGVHGRLRFIPDAVVLLVVGSVFPHVAIGATANAGPLLQAVLAKHAVVPAVYGGVVDHGRLIALGAAGLRKAGATVRAAPTDTVYLTDDTKPMTALLIGQLIAARQLAVTDTVGGLFPELRNTFNATAAKTTVADLLQDRAGLPKDVDWNALDQTRLPLPQQRRQVVRQALAVEPASSSTKAMVFSNVGYVILGAIVERRTGTPWEEAITTRVFRPLGMTSAGFGIPGAPWSTAQPWGHHVTAGQPTPTQEGEAPVIGPAGRVHCTIADWSRFAAVFCRQPGDHVPPLLDAQTIGEITAPPPGGTYAGGWFTQDAPWAGGTQMDLMGYNENWYASVRVAPGRGIAVLTVANCGGDEAKAACLDASDALIRQYVPAVTATPGLPPR